MKGPPIRGEQHPAFAAHCFADQKAFRSRHGQGGGVELDIFGVDDARPGAVRHGQPVSARAGRVGGVAVDAPQPAGCQDGRLGHVAVDGAFFAVKGKRAVADDRFIGGQRIARMVRKGDQVDRGHVGSRW